MCIKNVSSTGRNKNCSLSYGDAIREITDLFFLVILLWLKKV